MSNKRSSLKVNGDGSLRVKKQAPKSKTFEGHGKFKDKYQLGTQTLGSGAYATVKLGMNVNDGSRVAVKIIRKSKLKMKDVRKVETEVKILKSLNNENIIKIHDAYSDNENYYIVMDYCPDGDLLGRIAADEEFSEETARDLLEQIILGLKYCKENGVVHRDIKPENILIGPDGKIKLADFNLSKKLSKDEIEFSLLETECGTPNFVAPEVLKSRPYSYKCDIWSTGVILFVILSGGYLPFFPDDRHAKNAKRQLLERVAEGNWAFIPEESWETVSEEAKDLISHLLVKKPEERYTYEEILNHEWMAKKEVGKLSTQRNIIDTHSARVLTDRIRDLRSSHLLETAKQVYDAVETFRDIMTAKELVFEEDF